MNKPAQKFEDLIVWQKAHMMVLEIYKSTASFPKSELYSLTSQFRRAGISVPANIAEGFRKHSNLEKVRFLNIAQSSLEEVRYYIILSKELRYLQNDSLSEKATEVSRLLEKYISVIKNSRS